MQAGGENISQGSWFLAPGFQGSILLINVRGYGRQSEGSPIPYMGRELLSYPSMRCHVYAWFGHMAEPGAQGWVRQNDLQGCSLFLGVNYPFLLDAFEGVGGNAGIAEPVFMPDSVFATHRRCHQVPQPVPDWCRMSLNGVPSIGSSFQYAEPVWDDVFETPVWFVPTVPQW